MKNVVVVVDLQFGSTGKGQVAGTVGRKWGADTTVCANGPNAGHTYCWVKGENPRDVNGVQRIVHTVMPVCAVLPSVRNILLGPGAVIDLDRLQQEVQEAGVLLAGKRLIVHPNASIVTQEHREGEKKLIGIGSTMKGTAEAVIAKMRRLEGADIARNWVLALDAITRYGPMGFRVVVNEQEYNAALDSSSKLMVEGAQGASLSMHSHFYPHCTSRDVSVSQIWADCRLPQNQHGRTHVIGVCRTYPIRVANRLNEHGDVIGYSGSCYPDQKEITWASIGREPELTTVTKLPRRLFTFSTEQIIEAARYNAPTSIALTFCDYLPEHNKDHPDLPEGMLTYPVGPGELLSPAVFGMAHRIQAAAGCPVEFLSYGPLDQDLYRIAGVSEGYSKGRLSTSFNLPWE